MAPSTKEQQRAELHKTIDLADRERPAQISGVVSRLSGPPAESSLSTTTTGC